MTEQMNVQKLSDNVRKLNAKLEAHVGSRGATVHNVATEGQPGFLEPFDKQMINQRGRRATGLANDVSTDILTLTLGYYVGRLFDNAPTDPKGSLCTVDVSGYENWRVIKFTRLTDGIEYTRTIYADQYDSNWNNTGWVKIVPANGFTGHMAIKKTVDANHNTIELRIDVKGSYAPGAVLDLATLPSGYTTLDPNGVYFAGIGAIGTASSVPLGLYIHGGNKLSVFRADDGSDTVTGIRATIRIDQSDSTV